MAPRPLEPRPLPELAHKVVADFATAVSTSKNAYMKLFDFAAVGEFEILLHRYDLNGRLPLDPDQKAELEKEDGTPYPASREAKNVGDFYPILAQRTVATGDCKATAPRTRYGKLLAQPYEPLPAGTPPKYELLREHVNAWVAKGGVVRIKCAGGKGGLALVYTARDNERGYDLITLYDD
ncbi:MAG: hypothetical protein SFX73_04625 [Kofleriaceae bacterium]|nr:hypothetical protein [Kofleriaceae bacterium]